MLYSLITLFLTAIIYLIPLLIWLPFKLSRLQKICLYLIIFCNLCLISFFTGNIGVLLLLFTTGTYLALINPQRIQNIVLLILDYLFNVLWDNILTTLIWIFWHIDVASLQENHYYFLALIGFTIISDYFICKFLLHVFNQIYQRLNIINTHPFTVCHQYSRRTTGWLFTESDLFQHFYFLRLFLYFSVGSNTSYTDIQKRS